ncbi:hypothetical protein evm_000699 [Chilo suppressalis]|nr:hypothetical protein evm_000699 [Chilo suppressalis]
MIKYFLFISLAISFINAQHSHWDDYSQKDTDDVFNHCNESFCNQPCGGAKRPPFCPIRLPVPEACPTGCACMVICERRTVTCFELKHCLVKRRIFTRRRKA